MSKPHLTLPCKYKLNDFTKVDQGYHCSSCDHHLQDFRHLSPDELNQVLAASAGKTCGIFNHHQVTSKVNRFETGIQRRLGVSLLGILGFISPAILTSCNDHSGESVQHQQAFGTLDFPLYLKGKLMDQRTHKPVTEAQVWLDQDNKTILTARTDSRGKFVIRINEGDLNDHQFNLILRHQIYEEETLRHLEKQSPDKLDELEIFLEVGAPREALTGVSIPAPGQLRIEDAPPPMEQTIEFIEPIVVDEPIEPND